MRQPSGTYMGEKTAVEGNGTSVFAGAAKNDTPWRGDIRLTVSVTCGITGLPVLLEQTHILNREAAAFRLTPAADMTATAGPNGKVVLTVSLPSSFVPDEWKNSEGNVITIAQSIAETSDQGTKTDGDLFNDAIHKLPTEITDSYTFPASVHGKTVQFAQSFDMALSAFNTPLLKASGGISAYLASASVIPYSTPVAEKNSLVTRPVSEGTPVSGQNNPREVTHIDVHTLPNANYISAASVILISDLNRWGETSAIANTALWSSGNVLVPSASSTSPGTTLEDDKNPASGSPVTHKVRVALNTPIRLDALAPHYDTDSTEPNHHATCYVYVQNSQGHTQFAHSNDSQIGAGAATILRASIPA